MAAIVEFVTTNACILMRKLSARAARSPDLNLRLLLKCANYCDAQGQRDNTTPEKHLSINSLSADTNTSE
jgi:hypothetical protein